MTNPALQYIADVQAGKVVCGKYVRLAVQRHCGMLATAAERGITFDNQAAQHALYFIGLLRFTTGREFAGKHFQLAPWQAFIVWVIFGWKNEATGYRLITKVYVEIAKKNGKTELAAAIAVYMFLMDDEFGAEVYIGATKRAQSKICFTAIRQMILFLRRDSEYIRQVVAEPQTWNIHTNETKSKIEPLGKDSDSDQGINASCGIIDEYWAHPDSKVLGNLQSSMVSRTQPLLFIITTAGFNLESPCYKLRITSTEILEGLKEDDSFFAAIFSFDEGDDWQDRSLWVKPIPNLGVSVIAENIEKEFTRAKNEGPIEEKRFKTLNLNMWHETSFESWLTAEDWKACTGDFIEENMKDRLAFGGIDMAATSDIAAFVRFYPGQERNDLQKRIAAILNPEETAEKRRDCLDWLQYSYPATFAAVTLATPEDEIRHAAAALKATLPKNRLVFRSYYPRAALEEKSGSDKNSYSKWLKDGWIIPVESNVILSSAGRELMKKDIRHAFQQNRIEAIGFDEWNAYGLVSDLVDDGMSPETLLPYRMGYKSMSTPMKFFYSWVKEGDIEHNGDPVAAWMVSNVIAQTDGTNIKPDRRHSDGKIDGVVAAIIAIGQYLVWEANKQSNRSIYDNPVLWKDET